MKGFPQLCAFAIKANSLSRRDSQTFFLNNRLLWAMIMVPISMTRTAGQSTWSVSFFSSSVWTTADTNQVCSQNSRNSNRHDRQLCHLVHCRRAYRWCHSLSLGLDVLCLLCALEISQAYHCWPDLCSHCDSDCWL